MCTASTRHPRIFQVNPSETCQRLVGLLHTFMNRPNRGESTRAARVRLAGFLPRPVDAARGTGSWSAGFEQGFQRRCFNGRNAVVDHDLADRQTVADQRQCRAQTLSKRLPQNLHLRIGTSQFASGFVRFVRGTVVDNDNVKAARRAVGKLQDGQHRRA